MKAKKKAAIGCLAFFLLPLVFAPFCSDPTEVTSEESTEQTDLSSYIPGVEPVDVYLNLKNEGFKIDNPNEFITKMCNIMIEASKLSK